MMEVPKVYPMYDPIVFEKDFSIDGMIKVSTKNLTDWGLLLGHSVNTLAENQKLHDVSITDLMKKVNELDSFAAGTFDFLQFVKDAHPEIMDEYVRNRKAVERIAT